MKLYQIGSIPLNLIEQSLINDYAVDSRGKSQDMVSTINTLALDSQFLNKPRKMKIVGDLIDTQYQSADEVLVMLKSSVGKVLPIITYIVDGMFSVGEKVLTCCDDVHSVGNCDECKLVFYQSIGQITKVNELKQKSFDEPVELSIDVEIYTLFRGIDKYTWGFGGYRGIYDLASIVSTINLSNYESFRLQTPRCEELQQCIQECNSFFFRQITDSKYMLDRNNFSFLGSNQITLENNDVYIDPIQDVILRENVINNNLATMSISRKVWSAPPLSIYSIFNIQSDDFVTINITSSDGGVLRETQSTIIDIELTNNVLIDNGYEALDENDEIFLGDFRFVQNNVVVKSAVIKRNGNFITDAFPVVKFRGFFPAMIIPSMDTRVLISGADSSHLHFLRRV